MENVLASDQEIQTYYAKGSMKFYDGDQLTDQSSFEEYSDHGKRKIVTVNHENQKSTTLNDGKKVLTFDEMTNTAYSYDLSDNDGLPIAKTQREQLIDLFNSLSETHNYEITGEEKVSGRQAYKVAVTSKSKDSIVGDMELWVDQKSWFILKSKSISGDIRSETEYTEVDFSPTFSNETFTLHIPKDVEVTSMDDMSETSQVSIEEAEKSLGQPFLLFQNDEFSIDSIELSKLKGELNLQNVSIYYKQNNMPAFTLSIFPTPPEIGGEELGTKQTIRGVTGYFMEDLSYIIWDEGGLSYSILIENPDISVSEMISMAEQMKKSR